VLALDVLENPVEEHFGIGLPLKGGTVRII